MPMRLVKTGSTCGLLVLIAACGGSEGSPRSTGTGGSVSTGGSLATGGAIGTGGSTRTGGALGTGGSASTGGALGTGGMGASGLASGGTRTGGAPSTGGVVATGGTPRAGGATSAGGAGGTGGVAATVDAGAPDAPTSEAGTLGKTCGTVAGIPCSAGEFCQFPTDTCQVSDNAGVCDTIPSACTKELVPVCGCNNTTYDNDCLRRMAKAQKRANGACPVDAGTADTPKPATGSENSACGYGASTDCRIGLYCNFPPGTCGTGDASGTCTRPFSGGCATVYEPVCGCDNQTYSNDCALAVAGVSMKSTGTCR